MGQILKGDIGLVLAQYLGFWHRLMIVSVRRVGAGAIFAFENFLL